MKRQAKRQYTIRAVPADVDRELRRLAHARNQSLNDAVLDALRRGVGIENTQTVYNDLDELFGAVEPDPEIDRVLMEQRKVDPDLWR